ncbi:hypothetical protein PK35_05655 [Tamlana nanhaiensis]|uniref:Uncharacterized protein n=1 Tax=Neotamlana nanhaiensis TaxID=1382798 RepID=A0A0D7W2T8_9FLAO|nr:hypothetical protein [Tamlana nanhaiensis]KJD33344.1 hypothetical protein PK35_05655 [Tamlana nanhaiensis]
MPKNKFNLGEIVTFKSHPLLYDYYIRGDGKLVPPFLVISEIEFENKSKKVVEEVTGSKIAEKVKYKCVFFDDNRSQFKEVFVYQSMLESFKSICIARNNEVDKKETYESLISEASLYTVPNYEYSKIVYFKTKKFEIFKKRISVRQIKKKNKIIDKEIIQYVVNYATPDFVLTGIKKQIPENKFYSNGDKRKISSEILYKVKWFNSNQMKFSEQFLPSECFMKEQPFQTIIKHNHDSNEKESGK